MCSAFEAVADVQIGVFSLPADCALMVIATCLLSESTLNLPSDAMPGSSKISVLLPKQQGLFARLSYAMIDGRHGVTTRLLKSDQALEITDLEYVHKIQKSQFMHDENLGVRLDFNVDEAECGRFILNISSHADIISCGFGLAKQQRKKNSHV